MIALYAFREDGGFDVKFMGIVPLEEGMTPQDYLESLDDAENEIWPEGYYAFIIDLETLDVIYLDDEVVGQICRLTEYIEQAMRALYE